MTVYEGNIKPSSIEQATLETDLSAVRTSEIPSSQQMRCDYVGRTDGNPVYIGWGPRGLATSSEGWIIHKYTYDGDDQVTIRQIAYDAWDNHATTAVYA
jgi:YD repeat-containing protein